MRIAVAVLMLLLPAMTIAAQQEPVYIDQLMETPLETLQTQFPKLRKEGCYDIGDGRFLHVTIDKKDEKPWRVTLSATQPCRRAQPGPVLDVRQRQGVALGDPLLRIVEKMGRPDASAAPEKAQERLGEIEYFYVCRVSEGCARHTSIFIRDGAVTAISEWYSE